MLPELSTVLYYAMNSEAVTSLKTGNFVRHFGTLIVIRSQKSFFLGVDYPFVSGECKKISGSHHSKNVFLGLRKPVIYQKSAEKPFSKTKI